MRRLLVEIAAASKEVTTHTALTSVVETGTEQLGMSARRTGPASPDERRRTDPRSSFAKEEKPW
jgi:hypothetical protein